MADKLYTKAELSKKNKKELEELLDAHGLEMEEGEEYNAADLRAVLLDLGPDDALADEDDEDEELDDEAEEEEDDLELPDEDEEEDELPAPKTKSTKKPAAAKAAKKNSSGDDTLAAKQVATLLGTEAKTLRQFLRSDASTFEAVGSGGRYEFTEGDVPKIKAEFDAWKSAHAARGSKRTGTKGKDAKPAEVVAEVDEIEELDDEELDDEIEEDDLELEDEA